MDVILFVILSTFVLAVQFGIAWPLLFEAREKIDKWEDAPGARKVAYALALGLYVGICAGALITDLLVNLIVATIVFQRLPGSVSELLTHRIQGYLDEMSENPVHGFTKYQLLYMKFVVLVANKIDKTPHFKVPENVNL